MRVANLILVLDHLGQHVLMCHRQKPPYLNKLNFVGGKVELNEEKMISCYRELYEETGISANQLKLRPLMSFYYEKQNLELYVVCGRLQTPVLLIEENNPLCWISIQEDFNDLTRFAGNGNIKIMIDALSILRSEL